MIELPFQRLHPDAVVPAPAYPGDAGLDLSICEPLSLAPGERGFASTGLAVGIPAGHAGFVLPRSGLAAKHGITLVNAPGLIDSGYRGEIKLMLINTDQDEPFEAGAGERLAQLVVLAYPDVRPFAVEELEATSRGARGFGSSAT
ncbi:MAG: dUTP diphosphatase [Gaiellaceae bacterium]